MLAGILNFLVIQNFSALVTFVVGLSAFIIYALQKKNQKVSAALLILSEVRNAEQKVSEISELAKNNNKDFPRVLNTNSWRKYSHLFTFDFDQDQLSEMNQFYALCEDIDDYVQKDNEFFWINAQHRAKTVQEKLAEVILTSLDQKTLSSDDTRVKNLINNALDKFSNHYYPYTPQKTMNYLNEFLDRFNKITTTTTGSKLKKLAGESK